jgi:hypothetical protein
MRRWSCFQPTTAKTIRTQIHLRIHTATGSCDCSLKELLTMGTLVPETCWAASMWLSNKCCDWLLHLVRCFIWTNLLVPLYFFFSRKFMWMELHLFFIKLFSSLMYLLLLGYFVPDISKTYFVPLRLDEVWKDKRCKISLIAFNTQLTTEWQFSVNYWRALGIPVLTVSAFGNIRICFSRAPVEWQQLQENWS